MLGFDVCTARKVWTAFLIALLFFIIYIASSTVLVVVFAVFFSYLMYPMVDLVDRVRPRRVPRVASIALVFIVVVAVIAVVGSVFGVQLQDQATHLFAQLPTLMKSDVPNRFPLPHFLEPLRERIVDFVQQPDRDRFRQSRADGAQRRARRGARGQQSDLPRADSDSELPADQGRSADARRVSRSAERPASHAVGARSSPI